jgi:hypothetical protein
MKRSRSDSSSSDGSDWASSDSDEDAPYQTDLTDYEDSSDNHSNASVNKNATDLAWLLQDNAHPPEYYIDQLENFDESECLKQDYEASSTQLLDRIEQQWFL